MAEWLEGRIASAAQEAQEGLSSRMVLTDPAAALARSSGQELWPLLEIGITWLLFSNPDIHSSQPLSLPPCPSGRLCVICFLPPLPPAMTQPREPHSPIQEGSH